jgi:hypothetical protein
LESSFNYKEECRDKQDSGGEEDFSIRLCEWEQSG